MKSGVCVGRWSIRTCVQFGTPAGKLLPIPSNCGQKLRTTLPELPSLTLMGNVSSLPYSA